MDAQSRTPRKSNPLRYHQDEKEPNHDHHTTTTNSYRNVPLPAVSQAPLYIGTGFEPIFEANRHGIGDDPDLIHPGTVLRCPRTSSPDSPLRDAALTARCAVQIRDSYAAERLSCQSMYGCNTLGGEEHRHREC